MLYDYTYVNFTWYAEVGGVVIERRTAICCTIYKMMERWSTVFREVSSVESGGINISYQRPYLA